MGSHEPRSPEHEPGAPDHSAPDPAAVRARRALFLHLTGAYPTVPLRMVLAAVEECERAIVLCGDGPNERATMEVVARQNLDSLAAARGRQPE